MVSIGIANLDTLPLGNIEKLQPSRSDIVLARVSLGQLHVVLLVNSLEVAVEGHLDLTSEILLALGGNFLGATDPLLLRRQLVLVFELQSVSRSEHVLVNKSQCDIISVKLINNSNHAVPS